MALFAAATVQTTAFAKPKDDDDSIHSWATLVQPAAGPQTLTLLLAGLCAELNALAGVTETSYNGITLGSETPVEVTVNFSEGTWSGTWE